MGAGEILIAGVDAVAREATLFAAIWFLVGGIDDLLIDLVYFVRWLRHRGPAATLADLPVGTRGRLAVFVPAWAEAEVIGPMLRTALSRFDHPDFRIYVGTYPNDPATVNAVAAVMEDDARVRLVICPRPGPTTKANCLNAQWRALLCDEAVDGTQVKGVVLHDAEDVVHRAELRLFDRHLDSHEAVQLPVAPLPHPQSRFVSGHYLDEFTEAHARTLPVRQALGAGLPFAGVGCAIRRDMLGAIALARGGAPFDETSLTEDYELGLTVTAMGGRTAFVRVREGPGGALVAVRAYFPADLQAAVRQKARWMTGIALAGWDRIGWGPLHQLGEHWMRMRDRRMTLAMPVLATAYLALIAWGLSLLGHAVGDFRPPLPGGLHEPLVLVNMALFAWRMAVRAALVRCEYGWREAALSVPRLIVANYVSLLAARRAAFAYLAMLRGGALRWEKTAHEFPGQPKAA